MIDFAFHAARVGSGEYDDLDLLAVAIAGLQVDDAIKLCKYLAVIPAKPEWAALARFVGMVEDHAAQTTAQALVEELEPDPVVEFEWPDDAA